MGKRKEPLFHHKNDRTKMSAVQKQKKSSKQGQGKYKARTRTLNRKGKFRTDWVQERINPEERDMKRLKQAIKAFQTTINRNQRSLVDYLSDEMEGEAPQSPALEELYNSGGSILSTKGTYEEVYGEYLRGLEFVTNPTHTVTGYKKWYNEMESVFSDYFEASYDNLTEKEKQERIDTYWKAFNRIKQTHPWILAAPNVTTNLINDTKEECIRNLEMSVDDIYNHLLNYLEEDDREVEYSWTFATPDSYESAADVGTSYVYTRVDERRKRT